MIYTYPKLDLLFNRRNITNEEIKTANEQQETINKILNFNGILCNAVKYIINPTNIVHLIEAKSFNFFINHLKTIKDTLAMHLGCFNISIITSIANTNYAGIKIPKQNDIKHDIYIGDMLSDDEYYNNNYKLPIAIGLNSLGKKIFIDLAEMRHALCAGATLSGKTTFLNSLIMSIIYKKSPSDVRFILMDSKEIEFSKYENLPHLALPIANEYEDFVLALRWLSYEMERRLKICEDLGIDNFSELNEHLSSNCENKLPYLIMIIDDCVDWMEHNDIVQDCVVQLVQKAHIVGIHFILATQRPTVSVIKTKLKENLSTKFAFRVSSLMDSNVIMGKSCAEKLEGRGDMILRFPGLVDTRIQAAFVSNKEIKSVVQFLNYNNKVDHIITYKNVEQILEYNSYNENLKLGRDDEYFTEVCYYVVRNQNASVNQLQKIFGTTFNRMDNIFKYMQSLGIVSPTTPGTKRKVLVNEMELEEILNNL